MNKIELSAPTLEKSVEKQTCSAVASVLAEIKEEKAKRGTFKVTGSADLNTDVPQLLRLHGKMYVKYSK